MNYRKRFEKVVDSVVDIVYHTSLVIRKTSFARKGRIKIGPLRVEFDDNKYESDPDADPGRVN